MNEIERKLRILGINNLTTRNMVWHEKGKIVEATEVNIKIDGGEDVKEVILNDAGQEVLDNLADRLEAYEKALDEHYRNNKPH